SFMSKLSTGYWKLFDPTNGYTAIDARVAAYLPLDRVSQRYFFETDMLFRLNTLRAMVVDVPMDAFYGDEQSNLHIRQIVFEFLGKHARNFFKRIFYNYFLRDVSLASLELLAGVLLLSFGLIFGLSQWYTAVATGRPRPWEPSCWLLCRSCPGCSSCWHSFPTTSHRHQRPVSAIC